MASDLYAPLCLSVCLQNILKFFKMRFSDYIIEDYGFRGAVTYFYLRRTCYHFISICNIVVLLNFFWRKYDRDLQLFFSEKNSKHIVKQTELLQHGFYIENHSTIIFNNTSEIMYKFVTCSVG